MNVTPVVQLQRDHAQHIFDALVSSLDFGSGFLGDEDVEAGHKHDPATCWDCR